MTFWKFALALPFLTFALHFTQVPTLVSAGVGRWTVEFTLSDTTDVEVAIVNLRDSSIIRHLAAGMLGANPPAPLVANTLHQTLFWNGRGDMGDSIIVPSESLTVRVRAGMSVVLNKLVGNDPYRFGIPGVEGLWSLRGVVGNPDGFVYVFGTSTSDGASVVRRYDVTGNYIRTVFPFPASLPSSKLTGWGVNNWNGSYTPAVGSGTPVALSPFFISGVSGSGVHAFYGGGCRGVMMPVLDSGKLFFLDDGDSRNKMDCFSFSTDGSRTGDAVQIPFITSPDLPNSGCCPDVRAGFPLLCESPDRNNYYITGIWQYSGTTASDTGFWKDGQVFKVNKNTGVATSLIRLDSVPLTSSQRTVKINPYSSDFSSFSAIHGMACDDSGRLFICDRQHGQIGVYDTSGIFLGKVPVKYPDRVYVNHASEEMYVLSRNTSGYKRGSMVLYKFNSWRSSPAPACSVTVSSDASASPGFMVVVPQSDRTLIWVGNTGMNDVNIYENKGTSLVLLKALSSSSKNWFGGFFRPALDRRTETVYINDGWRGVGKITDWTKPEFVPCTLSTGKRLTGGDILIGFDNHMYVQGGGQTGDSLYRFTLDRRPAPANWPNTRHNVLTPGSWDHWGALLGFKGGAVSPDKKVALFSPFCVVALADSGQTERISVGGSYFPKDCDTIIMMNNTVLQGCLKYDLLGNLYVGINGRSKYHQRPAVFKNSTPYTNGVGSIVKYSKGGKGSVKGPGCCWTSDNLEADAVGYERIYTPGLAPFSGIGAGGAVGGTGCSCMSPRFDVDYYGRLFVPNAITDKVTVVDNNSNVIVTFGEYGNFDSQGPGSLEPGPSIPFCYPVGVVASDNYIYVTDFGNNRLAQVKMAYALENIHLPLTGSDDAAAPNRLPMTLAAAPNPFNPSVTLSLSGFLSEEISLKVYDLSGKVVADLTKKINQGRVIWNAQGIASGVYTIVAKNGTLTLTRKVIYSK
ncbi:MAG: T9SS type A sorting domain-containing protein [Fibrobacteres bacterium]|nr:T9SS type A sorting domain-containing protein [Fibrobacterota bacterium]